MSPFLTNRNPRHIINTVNYMRKGNSMELEWTDMARRQQQLQKPLERPRLRDSFLKHLLLEKKTFRQEAKRAIFAWKMAERKKRLVKMAGRVFAKNKV